MVSIACFRSPAAPQAITVPAPTLTVIPVPVQTFENPTATLTRLEVHAYPPESGVFVLNPLPLGASEYIKGADITIDAIANPGWYFVKWAGPVYGETDKTAHIILNTNETVVGIFQKIESSTSSTTQTDPIDNIILEMFGIEPMTFSDSSVEGMMFDDPSEIFYAGIYSEADIFNDHHLSDQTGMFGDNQSSRTDAPSSMAVAPSSTPTTPTMNDAVITISDSVVLPNQTVTLSGSGFVPNANIRISIETCCSDPEFIHWEKIENNRTGNDGTWVSQVMIPVTRSLASSPLERNAAIIVTSSDNIEPPVSAQTQITLPAQVITVVPPQQQGCMPITISGSGFPIRHQGSVSQDLPLDWPFFVRGSTSPEITFKFFLDNNPHPTISINTDENGNFALPTQIPCPGSPGQTVSIIIYYNLYYPDWLGNIPCSNRQDYADELQKYCGDTWEEGMFSTTYRYTIPPTPVPEPNTLTTPTTGTDIADTPVTPTPTPAHDPDWVYRWDTLQANPFVVHSKTLPNLRIYIAPEGYTSIWGTMDNHNFDRSINAPTNNPLPFNCNIIPYVIDADRPNNSPLPFINVIWSINGERVKSFTNERGKTGQGYGFLIKPSVFGFQIGTNTLIADIDMMDGLWSNKQQPGGGSDITASIEITFIEGGC